MWNLMPHVPSNPRVPQALGDHAGIVGALVITFDLAENFLRVFRLEAVMEMVGAGQQQGNERLLVVGHDGQDVEADALGERRFVQQPVALYFFERLRNALHGNWFELEIHNLS